MARMDLQFLPAEACIRHGKLRTLKAILSVRPSLAQARSSCSHPTLMQCLVLDARELDEWYRDLPSGTTAEQQHSRVDQDVRQA